MKKLMMLILLTAPFAAARSAHAAPCNSYTRNVVFADGSQRLAYGTACLTRDGQWRVADEYLTRTPARSRVSYYRPYYYPRYYHYNPYPVFLSFGYGWGWGHGRHHHHHHW